VAVYDQILYVREIIYKTKMTNEDLIKLMKVKISYIRRGSTIYADSAEPQRIEEIRRAGFKILPSDKNKQDGIMTVKELHPKIKSYNNNVNLHKEMSSYVYKKDISGKFTDEPVKDSDHLLDALRYALHTRFKKQKKAQNVEFYF